jgi:CRP-like cAMP-binding protein
VHGPRATLAELVKRLERFAPLDGGDRAALLALPHAIRTLSPGIHLIRDGERSEQCSLLLSGFACRYKLTGDGGRQIIAIHMPSEFVDLQNIFLSRADHSVQTLSEVELAVISQQAMREVAASRPAIARALWVDTLIEASVFREWVVNVGRRDSRARVAHILCELSLRLGAAGLSFEHSYELPMTQEQLADAVGLTSVHVNRVLKQLAGDGLISRDRRAIRIEDWSRMRAAGDFNERYLHLDRAG